MTCWMTCTALSAALHDLQPSITQCRPMLSHTPVCVHTKELYMKVLHSFNGFTNLTIQTVLVVYEPTYQYSGCR